MDTLTLDPKTTALVLIDLQNGIVSLPLAPHSAADVVKNCVTLADTLRTKGGTPVFVHVLMHDTLRLPVDQSMGGDTPPPPSASEFVPELNIQPGDVVITKRQWGAFYGTNLDQQLRRRGIKTIIMGGIATNIGVESTARAAYDQGYALVFAEDAMTTMGAEAHHAVTKGIFTRMGRVRTTEQIVAALK